MSRDRSNLTRPTFLKLLLAAVFHISCRPTQSAPPPAVVVGIDLTRSAILDQPQEPATTTEYDRNLEAARRLIQLLPSGTRITILGITGNTFSAPHIVYSGELPDDPGPLPMLDAIDAEKLRILGELDKLPEARQLKFRTTDVLGLFAHAGEELKAWPERRRRIVVVFTDGRESTHIDLEKEGREQAEIDVEKALKSAEKQELIPDLSGVEIWVFGVHARHRDARYVRELRDFWERYFEKTGATLKRFSMTWNVEEVFR